MIRKIATAAACAAAFLLTSAVPSAKIYAEEPAAQDTIKVYEISMSDLDPIDTREFDTYIFWQISEHSVNAMFF